MLLKSCLVSCFKKYRVLTAKARRVSKHLKNDWSVIRFILFYIERHEKCIVSEILKTDNKNEK